MPDYNTGTTTAAVSVTAATAKTVLSIITGATRRARVKELFVGASSVTSTDAPMLVELVQFDTDGTGTSQTPVPLDAAEPAAICTSKVNYSAEPTTNAVVKKHWLVPPSGSLILQNPLGEEEVLPVSKTLALRVTAPQSQSVRANLKFAE